MFRSLYLRTGRAAAKNDMSEFAKTDISDRIGPPWYRVLFDGVLLAAVFSILERVVRTAGALPEAAYQNPSIVWGIAVRSGEGSPVGLVAGVTLSATALFFALRHPKGRAFLGAWAGRWRDWEHGAALRVLIGVIAGIGAWTVVSYGTNPFFGQAYLTDRVLLLALFAVVLWRPAGILPFVVLLIALVGQLDHPLPDHPWLQMNLVIRVLVLFAATHLLGVIRGVRNVETFLLVLCCLIAVNYWWSGQGKLRIGWIQHRHLNLLILGAYATGWLTHFSPEAIVRASNALSPLNTPLMLFTLVVEWGAVLLLWRRWSLVGFLFCAAALHTGIFAFTGMLFWKWIVIEVALLWFLLSGQRVKRLPIFTRAHFATSVLLILGCRVWVQGQDLSWYDTPLTYTVRLSGIGASGTTYAIPTWDTAPYSDMFFLAPFRYLTADPQLTSSMGAAGPPHALADSLLNAESAEAVLAIEHAAPATAVDSAKAEDFDRLVASIASHLNRKGSEESWTRVLRAPPYLWSFPRRDEVVFASQERLVQVAVDVVLTYYDGTTLEDIERRRVRTIDVPR